MCVGFSDVLVPASPKFHDHPVGLPLEVSRKDTVCELTGATGEYEKDATGAASAAMTVIVWLELLEPWELSTLSVTV